MQRLEAKTSNKEVSASAHVSLKTERSLLAAYEAVRALSLCLAEPLAPEDQQLQSMPEASPSKWHLAHNTWFFETFILKRFLRGYKPAHASFDYLFNSYYQAIGPQYLRARRSMLSRPSVSEVLQYRAHVDAAMRRLLEQLPSDAAEFESLVMLGLNHEQQHQELLLTDIKHAFSLNPLFPAYQAQARMPPSADRLPMNWVSFNAGLYEIGHAGAGFCFDNEQPRHRVFQEAFALANRLVTNEEYLRFIKDGGYQTSQYWLSEGWEWVQQEQRICPLYWYDSGDCENGDPKSGDRESGDRKTGEHNKVFDAEFSLGGLRPLSPAAPVCHLTYYEANAYANWSGARLPTEQEWEIGASSVPCEGNLLSLEQLHPLPATAGSGLKQMFGDVWEWTSSAYGPYPGFKAPPGAVGEYNGKFMCNQLVLRGGSCVTPPGHVRPSYRNFFPPSAAWQFSGLRLARDL